jgi:hypothetical protein
MRKEINQLVILALAAAFFLGISSARAADEMPVGKIERIYAEANRGVRIEQTLGQVPKNAKRWALVDFGRHTTQPRRRVIVLLPPELKAEQGDLVAVSLDSTYRATLISAKWSTPQAEAFDGSPLASSSRLRAASPVF